MVHSRSNSPRRNSLLSLSIPLPINLDNWIQGFKEMEPGFLQSLTVQSADEVNIDLLSGLQSQAIYTSTSVFITTDEKS